jgi:hypothetical protein
MRRLTRFTLCATSALLLSGCLVLPKVDMNQPVPCPLVTREVTLDVVQMAGVGPCRQHDCLLQLTAGTVIFAASAVVSGSVALVGNVLHWVERTQKCGLSASEPAPPVPLGSTLNKS